MNILKAITIGGFGCLAAFTVQAKVSEQDAAKLGNELTVMGAQQSGNDAGTIPAYEGGMSSVVMAEQLSAEKPLFVITAENFEQYAANLTPGQIKMFQTFPDSYTMPVYKTYRSARYPEVIAEKALKNAVTAELRDGGNGLMNFDETVPFAIPNNGLEVIWNHITRYRGGSVEINQAVIPVQGDGSFTPIKTVALLTSPQYLKDGYSDKSDSNILFYYTSRTKEPARFSGNVLLVHETMDQVKESRKAWIYNAGQRRVRRAPQLAYDAPDVDSLRTTDQVDMFNGAPDRYNWTLVGKKEIYIPYNSHKIMDKTAKYRDIVKPGHINQDYSRYELHRVWQVEATLKDNERHVYSKRTLYVDEDTWQIALADHYDNRGELWRVSEGHTIQFVEGNTPFYASITNYDLFSGRYLVSLFNEESKPFNFDAIVKRKYFTPGSLRRRAKR